MFKRFLYFAKYNNAFTLIIFICFFSFGLSFAANDTVRESIYSSSDTIVSIDNRLILNTDLDNFNFNLRITSITEDGKNYYAAYSYQTLEVSDGIWQSVPIEKVLTVSKEALGSKDLGLFLAKELGDNVSYELSYLKRAQKLEQERGESQKVVTTEYSGLIGKLLDPKDKVIEGYNPVVPEPAPEVPAEVELHPEKVIVTNDEDTSNENSDQSVNTKLVQEVVEQLLSGSATTTSATTTESTPNQTASTTSTTTESAPATASSTESGSTSSGSTVESEAPPANTVTSPVTTETPSVETVTIPAPEAPAPEVPTPEAPAQ